MSYTIWSEHKLDWLFYCSVGHTQEIWSGGGIFVTQFNMGLHGHKKYEMWNVKLVDLNFDITNLVSNIKNK